MADWTDPPYPQLVAGKPWTDEKAAAAFENPVAIAEGAPGAPRVEALAQKVFPVVSGAEAQTQVFTGLGDYYGIEFEAYIKTDTNRIVQFAYSTDNGSTWSANQIIGTTASDSYGLSFVHGTFDFATGNLRSIFSSKPAGAPVLTVTSVSMEGASLQIDAIRIQVASGLVIAMIKPNGGTA